jgi:hypothetical protein
MRSTVEEAGLRIRPSLGSSLFRCTKAEDLITKTDLHQRQTGIGRGFSHWCSQFVSMLQLMVLPQTLGLSDSRLSPRSGYLDFPQFLTTRLGKTCSSLLLPKSPGHEDQAYGRSDESPPARMQGRPRPMQGSCCISRVLLYGFMALRARWGGFQLQRKPLLRTRETAATATMIPFRTVHPSHFALFAKPRQAARLAFRFQPRPACIPHESLLARM